MSPAAPPDGPDGGLTLSEGFAASGLTSWQVWLLQVAAGGGAGHLEVEAYVLGLLRPDSHQHQILAQALNERFLDLGLDHLVAYGPEGS